MTDKTRFYYEARSFSVYYIANAAWNVVRNSQSYLRGIEDLLGDMQALTLMRPFHRFTNLHHFLSGIIREIVEEEVGELDFQEPRLLGQFLSVYAVAHTATDLEDEERFYDFTSESDRYHDALDELTDEVFHVLFNDVQFLEHFNRLCSDYIGNCGFGGELRKKAGTLKRVAIPVWAQRAIFHRDKGECRQCKTSVASTINQVESERYDHIIPLAGFGANDVTNLQLLCERCNGRKSALLVSVSPMYPKAILPR